jgi:hypothetical protein
VNLRALGAGASCATLGGFLSGALRGPPTGATQCGEPVDGVCKFRVGTRDPLEHLARTRNIARRLEKIAE